ncbi:MAG: response regulator [Phycisphaerae bacterium]
MTNELKSRAIGQADPGSHVCVLAESAGQADSVLLDLLRIAMQRRRRLLYLASQRQHHHLCALARQQQLDPDSLQQRGILLLDHEEGDYVSDDRVQTQALLELIDQQTDQAESDGLDGLIVAWDLTGVLQRSRPDLAGLLDSAGRISQAVSSKNCIFADICRRDRFDPTFLLDLLARQTHVLTGGRLLENHFYLPQLAGAAPQDSGKILDGVIQALARAEQSGQSSQTRMQRYRQILEAIGTPVLVLDSRGRLVEMNRQAATTHGIAESELIGRPYVESFIQPEDRTRFTAAADHVLKTREPAVLEARLITHTGVRIMRWNLTAVQASADWQGGLVVAAEDITSQRKAETQVAEAQKLETIGQLAGGIAHHFNNLLTIIMGNAELMQRTVGPGSGCLHMADQVINAAQRASDLTSQLLAFARKGQFKNVPIELNDLILQAVGLLEATIDKRIEIQLRLEARPSSTMGDPAQLENAILNLALNARDAMPQGGTLMISTDLVEIDQPEQWFEDVEAGRYIRIQVRDSGIGMDEETLSRIFEPFFTTKEVGKGAGLGLASVYGCVQNHHGGVRAMSVPDNGTTIEVYLPLIRPQESSRTDPADDQARHTASQGRILLVDDEESVRSFGAEVLRRQGYDVVTCANGSEAVEIYQADQQFDLVILDMVMPKLDGLETFRALRQIDPQVKAMLSSGFSISDLPQEILDEGVMDFLAKPYRIDQLSDKVARAIAREC